MKRKFMALLISFSMIFSAMVSIPAKVFAEGVDTSGSLVCGYCSIRIYHNRFCKFSALLEDECLGARRVRRNL